MERPSRDLWSPLSIDEVQATFSGSRFRWWVCGGRALEMYAGRSWRAHADTDVGIRRDQVGLVADQLAGLDIWVAAKGELTPWDGGALSPARHENNLWVRDPANGEWLVDLTINSGNDDEWIYRRDEAVRRPWSEAILTSDDGIPYLAPELQLLFKSANPRPKDHEDAGQVLPQLSAKRKEFLRRALPDGHPWR